jgi:hypothetical protein
MMGQVNESNHILSEKITYLEDVEKQLQLNARELDEFNAAMIGRESRVIELKEEVNTFCAELGRAEKYPPVWGTVSEDREQKAGGKEE